MCGRSKEIGQDGKNYRSAGSLQIGGGCCDVVEVTATSGQQKEHWFARLWLQGKYQPTSHSQANGFAAAMQNDKAQLSLGWPCNLSRGIGHSSRLPHIKPALLRRSTNNPSDHSFLDGLPPSSHLAPRTRAVT
jgi:hypothetical protein